MDEARIYPFDTKPMLIKYRPREAYIHTNRHERTNV
jgi:hypothetical protein